MANGRFRFGAIPLFSPSANIKKEVVCLTSKAKRKLTEWLFLAPTLLAFVLVIIIPFILGIYYSFTDWQGTGAVSKFVGLENSKAIFQEPAFLHSFLKTLLFTVLNILTVNVVAFIISLLVTSEIRGRTVYRAGVCRT